MRLSRILYRTFVIAALSGALLVYLMSPARPPAGGKAATDRKAAPDFALEDASGRQVRLSGYKGKVVLLNFCATWCGPCKVEIPWFIEFNKTYKDRGFAVLGVSLDDDGWKSVT